jgi:branched-chain amino acid transport system ATP-binding protein
MSSAPISVTAVLEVEALSVSYGGHMALAGVSLALGKGETTVMLGANGAGKSTLLKTIAGLLRARPGGRIVFDGRDIGRLEPHAIVELGVALVPEGRGIFGELTVSENLKLGAFAKRARGRERERLEHVLALFPRLAERRRQTARSLSGGEQQMLAIGRALMSCPDLLLLDEPSLGLSPRLSGELFRTLQAIGSGGVAILLVEQNVQQGLTISQHGYVLANGHIIVQGNPAALRRDPLVAQGYLGL